MGVAFYGGGQKLTSQGVVTGSTELTDVTCSTSANTLGSAVTIVSSSAEATGFILQVQNPTGNPQGGLTLHLLTLYMNTGGSDQAIVSDLPVQFYGKFVCQQIYIPLRIPSGAAIKAKAQCSSAFNPATRVGVGITPIIGTPLMGGSFGRCTTYGSSTSTSKGTALDAGGTANTLGSWTQLTSSTTNPGRAAIVAFGGNASQASNVRFRVNLGIGAGGSERIVIPDIIAGVNSGQATLSPLFVGPFPVNIPSGTRIAGQSACSSNTANARVINAAILLFD